MITNKVRICFSFLKPVFYKTPFRKNVTTDSSKFVEPRKICFLVTGQKKVVVACFNFLFKFIIFIGIIDIYVEAGNDNCN